MTKFLKVLSSARSLNQEIGKFESMEHLKLVVVHKLHKELVPFVRNLVLGGLSLAVKLNTPTTF